ncbi:MAG: sulfatase [Myxococcota bacterium]|nr:sulfatase [Myxococcota bacterium]
MTTDGAMLPRGARPIRDVLGAGVLTGAIAGLAIGAIDALWSWGPAAQFVPGFLARVRFVAFSAFAHAAAGALIGLVLACILLVLSRASRLGDLMRFARADHRARRARDPREALSGLSLVIVTLPMVSGALFVAYRIALPTLANRKVPSLVIAVSMAIAIAAVLVAIPISFVLARGVEHGLRAIAKQPRLGRALSCFYAPFVAAGVLLVAAAVLWAVRDWETARVLPLRAPIVCAVGLLLAVPAIRPAWAIVERLAALRPAVRRVSWAALPFVLLGLVLVSGATGTVKAASAYTGLGGPIARNLRRAFDWDRDSYARFLGGGDCDDGDRSVHPGAPENPDDGIDQNCVGGDATVKRSADDVGFVPVPASVPKDFDILLVTIDTTRADHLGAYGYKRATSPNIDKLAAQGTVFEHGWAHAPSTRYSIPAILTGRLPLDVYYDTSVDGWPGLAPKATTLGEALQPLGFVTGAITNYWYFDRVRRMDQGFTEYDNANASLHHGVSGAGPEQTKGSSSKEQTDKAIAFVDKHQNDRWFLWVHYYDPHYAYEPHAEVTPFGTDRVALYDGEIKFTDLHLGRLLDRVGPNTVVVITGDHGEGFGEHNVDLHGYHLYAPQTKVPMIVRVPGMAPRRSQMPAGHIDILPTLVNLAGGTALPEMMGTSLVGAIGGADRDRVVFQQLSYEGNHEMRGGADKDCHVIYNVSPDTSWEVYRTDTDPLETQDLADTGECSATRRAVEHWFDAEQVPAGAAQALLSARPQIATPLDVDFGDGVRLLSVEVPKTLKPGEQGEITWTFEARDEVAPGWKMFVHIEGPAKSFINADHRPARPFEWWRTGQFIRYATTMTVPRAAVKGTYVVNAGMFKGKKRAPAKSAKTKIANNAAAVATFEVSP